MGRYERASAAIIVCRDRVCRNPVSVICEETSATKKRSPLCACECSIIQQFAAVVVPTLGYRGKGVAWTDTKSRWVYLGKGLAADPQLAFGFRTTVWKCATISGLSDCEASRLGMGIKPGVVAHVHGCE